MSQSKSHSVIESFLNVLSGMVIAFVISQVASHMQAEIRYYLWSGFVWNISVKSNIVMTLLFTVVSLGRGYFWRRYFNDIQRKKKCCGKCK
jgi:hypothetical protein